jgi:hypothetical protein
MREAVIWPLFMHHLTNTSFIAEFFLFLFILRIIIFAHNKTKIMRKILTLFFVSGILTVSAQNYNVTFRVDMSQVSSINSVICVAGDFQTAAGYVANWTPGITTLSDSDSDSIYDITVSVPAGTYEYKFFNGDAWGSDESVPGTCAVNYNRQVIVTGDVVLSTVCYSECGPCPPPGLSYSLTFQVDMSQVPTIAATVSVTGDFQTAAGLGSNWTPGAAAMIDPELDKIYSLSVIIPPGTYQFRYVNGDAWGLDEIITGPCSVNNNREISLGSNTILDVVCFSGCGPCAGSGLPEESTGQYNVFTNDEHTFLNIAGIISDNPVQYRISDMCGKNILNEYSSGTSHQIDISNLRSGLYILSIVSPAGYYNHKFTR